jgi:hypothetical protein
MMEAIPKRRFRRSLFAWLLPAAALLVFAAANAHLVYVAFDSQPACVEHVKAPGSGQGYSAAKSAC